jgi:hypothetical protein
MRTKGIRVAANLHFIEMETGSLYTALWFVSNRIATLGAARETSLKFLVQKELHCQHPRAGDGTTLFVTLWEFEVKPGSAELFEHTYGPEGQWLTLFRRDSPRKHRRRIRCWIKKCEQLTISEKTSR